MSSINVFNNKNLKRKITVLNDDENIENFICVTSLKYKPIIHDNKGFRHDVDRSPFQDIALTNGRKSPFDEKGYLINK